jgi:sulfur carrier protein
LLTVRINGNERSFDESSMTLEQLVVKLGLVGKRLAIECNGEIVPKSLFSGVVIKQGDQLEIVGAVGGG